MMVAAQQARPVGAVSAMTTATPNPDRDPLAEVAALRHRLSGLSAASLRINESLDLDAVLQGVLDAARSLAGARYGVLAVMDDGGRVEALLASGLSPEEFRGLREIPGGEGISRYLVGLSGPLRVADFAAHARARGLPGFLPPVPVRAFLAVPIRRLGDGVGHVYLAHGEPGEAFSAEDEETLVMFAAQAALVIANARRHREERRARAGLEALVDTSPVAVVVFDVAAGAPASFNREALRIAEGLGGPGHPPGELLERLTIRRADGREEDLAKLPLTGLMRAGETVRAEEITLIAPGGRSVPVLLNATPIRSEAGAVESYVVTLQDLTELEELGRLRAEFLGLVSHELRTPLAAVRGSVTTLLEAGAELEPAETEQFHRIIRDQSERMRRLIGDLLDLARLETSTLTVSPAPVELAAIVEDARQRFLGGDGRNVELDIELPPGLPPVRADGRRMAQALAHLLAHVAARLPLGAPLIRVGAAREALYVAVSVAAAGRATPHAPPPRGTFPGVERADAGGAAGLGLAICRGIVEAHGGRLRAERDGTDGAARFTLTVPAAEWEPGAGAVAGAVADAERSRTDAEDRLRVLAVVADPQTLRQVRDALWDAGYAPVAAADPEDIPRLLREERPRLALLDATPPGSEALLPELVRGILGEADAPVILLAAPGQEEAMAQALDLGVSDYLVRPFSGAELAARVRAALRRHEAPHLAASPDAYVLGRLTVDFARQRVSVAGSDVALTPNEYALLAELAVNAGRTLAHDDLLERVWSPDRRGRRWLLREVVKRLRLKLGDDARNPAYIFTVSRAGYRLGPAEAGGEASTEAAAAE